MSRSRGVISIGSLKFCSVKAAEWRTPCSLLATHLASPACGRWHSTQVAVWRWPLLSQPSYCVFITWQFTHARGSVERYENPFAYTKVKAPTPSGMPTTQASTTARVPRFTPSGVLGLRHGRRRHDDGSVRSRHPAPREAELLDEREVARDDEDAEERGDQHAPEHGGAHDVLGAG